MCRHEFRTKPFVVVQLHCWNDKLMTIVLIQARPLLEEKNIQKLIDPRLESKFDLNEFKSMMISAALCIRHAAHRRPQMSKVSYLT